MVILKGVSPYIKVHEVWGPVSCHDPSYPPRGTTHPSPSQPLHRLAGASKCSIRNGSAQRGWPPDKLEWFPLGFWVTVRIICFFFSKLKIWQLRSRKKKHGFLLNVWYDVPFSQCKWRFRGLDGRCVFSKKLPPCWPPYGFTRKLHHLLWWENVSPNSRRV